MARLLDAQLLEDQQLLDGCVGSSPANRTVGAVQTVAARCWGRLVESIRSALGIHTLCYGYMYTVSKACNCSANSAPERLPGRCIIIECGSRCVW